MHRLVVALLAAVDAVVAAAVGLGAVLAPLTLVWVFTFSGTADWSALWPASARVWQLGNLVPMTLTLDDLFLVGTGLPPEAASFAVSLAPLAFAAFILFFAARSGRRAARAGAWGTGVATGAVVTLAIATVVQLTSANPIATVSAWQAILFPALLYGVAALAGAVVTAWGEGDEGLVDALHDRVDGMHPSWRAVPALAIRGAALALTALIGLGALAVAAAVMLRGGEVVALFEASRADAIGVVGVSLAQLAYLPTLVVWGTAWTAGPGFAVGTATAVSPGGVHLGVVPGIPALGLLPEQGTPWLLLVMLAPVAVGALAGWMLRTRLVEEWQAEGVENEPYLPRIALSAAVAVLAAGGAALLTVFSSGAMGPGRLAEIGPAAGPVALAVGVEVLLGAAILLLGPRVTSRHRAHVS